MDVLEAGTPTRNAVRRCHLWCWSYPPGGAEWEKRTFVLGGLSFVGVITAAGTAAISAGGNRRRRARAIAASAPNWQYVTSGLGHVTDGQLVLTEPSGIVRCLDLPAATGLGTPAPGWLRFQPPGSTTPWAVQVM